MVLTARARPEARERIPAVIHHDGTGACRSSAPRSNRSARVSRAMGRRVGVEARQHVAQRRRADRPDAGARARDAAPLPGARCGADGFRRRPVFAALHGGAGGDGGASANGSRTGRPRQANVWRPRANAHAAGSGARAPRPQRSPPRRSARRAGVQATRWRQWAGRNTLSPGPSTRSSASSSMLSRARPLTGKETHSASGWSYENLPIRRSLAVRDDPLDTDALPLQQSLDRFVGALRWKAGEDAQFRGGDGAIFVVRTRYRQWRCSTSRTGPGLRRLTICSNSSVFNWRRSMRPPLHGQAGGSV